MFRLQLELKCYTEEIKRHVYTQLQYYKNFQNINNFCIKYFFYIPQFRRNDTRPFYVDYPVHVYKLITTTVSCFTAVSNFFYLKLHLRESYSLIIVELHSIRVLQCKIKRLKDVI